MEGKVKVETKVLHACDEIADGMHECCANRLSLKPKYFHVYV